MSISKILIQLDTDRQSSVFDGVVAADSGVDQLFRHAAIAPEDVRDLVYGAMFTRAPDDLKRTAVFVGGSNVQAGEAVRDAVCESFFGPVRVSVMLDSNGCNTTSAAAVLAAGRHVDWSNATALVLAATGPVGRRVAKLLVHAGARVRVASRNVTRAEAVRDDLVADWEGAQVEAHAVNSEVTLRRAMENVNVVFCAGAAGVQLLSADAMRSSSTLRVAVDLNAVPPLGIEAIEVTDKAIERDGVLVYGAVGVGGLKMKIHKAAIASLFTANDRVLDAEEIYALGQVLA